MKFNAVQIKQVMQKTNSAEWDCQRALAEQDGNVDAAIRFLYESSKVMLDGVQVYDWWKVADTPIFSPEQYKDVRDRTGADEFVCERALAESGGNVEQAVALAQRYQKESQL